METKLLIFIVIYCKFGNYRYMEIITIYSETGILRQNEVVMQGLRRFFRRRGA